MSHAPTAYETGWDAAISFCVGEAREAFNRPGHRAAAMAYIINIEERKFCPALSDGERELKSWLDHPCWHAHQYEFHHVNRRRFFPPRPATEDPGNVELASWTRPWRWYLKADMAQAAYLRVIQATTGGFRVHSGR